MILGRIGSRGIDAATRIVGFVVAMGMGLIFHGVRGSPGLFAVRDAALMRIVTFSTPVTSQAAPVLSDPRRLHAFSLVMLATVCQCCRN